MDIWFDTHNENLWYRNIFFLSMISEAKAYASLGLSYVLWWLLKITSPAMDLASINVIDTHLATLKIKGTARTDDIWKEWVTGLELLTQNYITYWILGAPR